MFWPLGPTINPKASSDHIEVAFPKAKQKYMCVSGFPTLPPYLGPTWPTLKFLSPLGLHFDKKLLSEINLMIL